MRSPYVFLYFIITFIFCACGKNEFYLNFDLSKEITKNYRIQYYASNKKGGRFVQTAVPILNGKARIKGITRNPTVVYLYDRGDNPLLVLYAEKGQTIKISGTTDDPWEWDVEGNSTNELIDKWRKDNPKLFSKYDNQKINASIARFVNQGRSEMAGTILMLIYYDRRIDENGYENLWNTIPEKYKPQSLLSSIGRSDQLTAELIKPSSIEEIILINDKDSLVQLKLSSSKATLLAFWSLNNSNIPTMQDSLGKLFSRTSSDRLQIADIGLNTDTLGWHRRLRSDSVGDWIHANIPIGEASDLARQLNVGRTPYFIVLSSKGKYLYRGEDFKKAIKTAEDSSK